MTVLLLLFLPNYKITFAKCPGSDTINRVQSENDLLEGIENETLYGFLCCDLTSSDATIEKWKKFPLLLKRMTVTFEHLSPSMQKQLEIEKPGETKFERETLVQCFNVKNILILSSLLKFYISQGVEVSNVRYFVQYVPTKCLDPFATHDKGFEDIFKS